MRVTIPRFKARQTELPPGVGDGRRPGREPVRFQQLLPLRLRNHVSGKGEKTANVACLQEMAVMFACMKDNEFKEAKCGPQIERFQKCYSEHMTQKKEKKRKEDSGEVVAGTDSRKLSYRQLNQLLSKFPQVNK